MWRYGRNPYQLFIFSPWAETNEEIEYKRELETEEEREKNKTNA